MAQVFSRLGSIVTVIEKADSILPREDVGSLGAASDSLGKRGCSVLARHKAVAAKRTHAGKEITAKGSGGTASQVLGDEILVAIGMRPFTASLGLDNVGVETDDRGAVRVDRTMRTTAPRVWAAGDVTGKLFHSRCQLPSASRCAQHVLPFPAKADYSRIPWATFTDPVLARIGLTEREAREQQGDRIGIHRYSLENLDRASTDRFAPGLVKLITDRRGRLLGGHILGNGADAVIHEVALAMRARVKIGELSQMVHVYPTMSEGVRRAADSYYAQLFAHSRFRPLLRWWVRR